MWKFIIYFVIASYLFGSMIEEFGISHGTSFVLGMGVMVAIILLSLGIRFFTHFGRVRARAAAIKQARKIRIHKEFMESWNRVHRKFVRRMEREEEKQIARMSFGDNYPSR